MVTKKKGQPQFSSLSNEQLKDFATEHLRYEVVMLAWSTGVIAAVGPNAAKGELAWFLHNATLNSFAVHARNLCQFLYPGAPKEERVDVRMYVDPDDLSKSLPPKSPLIGQIFTKASRQVAHLTPERLTVYDKAGKEWPVGQVAMELLQALASVIPGVPLSKMSEEVKQELATMRYRIPVIDVGLNSVPGRGPSAIQLSLRLTENGYVAGYI